jgi:hypothetical protein
VVAAAALAIGGLATTADAAGGGLATTADAAGGLATTADAAGGLATTADAAATFAPIWRAIDGASWVAPQLVACAFLVEPAFVARAEERLLGVERRPPKTMGALVRAYHRLPAPRMPVVAQLRRHDMLLASEEAHVGIRGFDAWLDGLPSLASDASRARWLRLPR